MDFCIKTNEIRKALKEIESAEKNGFLHCLAVFKFSQAGPCTDQNLAEYSDLCEKAHPTDPNLDWGRFQGMTRRYKFVNGNLVTLSKPKRGK